MTSFNTLISTALSTLLKDGPLAGILVEKAGGKSNFHFQGPFYFQYLVQRIRELNGLVLRCHS